VVTPLIKKIILPKVITNNIVTYKKFYALEKLKNNAAGDIFQSQSS
jgi:hypothetical protein